MFNQMETKIQLPPPPAALKIASSIPIQVRAGRKPLEQKAGAVLPLLLSRETIQQELGLGNLL